MNLHVQEAKLLENGCYHRNMHLKMGHGREEKPRKECYVVFILKKYPHLGVTNHWTGLLDWNTGLN